MAPRYAAIEFVKEAAASDTEECIIWPFASKDRQGYGHLSIEGRLTGAHVAVCTIKHGSKPTPKHQAAHSCGNGHLGCINPNHLRWATARENLQDKILHGRLIRGTKVKSAKLSESQVLDIREALSDGATKAGLARQYGVTFMTISAIGTRRHWAWL